MCSDGSAHRARSPLEEHTVDAVLSEPPGDRATCEAGANYQNTCHGTFFPWA